MAGQGSRLKSAWAWELLEASSFLARRTVQYTDEDTTEADVWGDWFFETTSTDRRGQVSFTEAEVPTAPRRAFVSFGEFEAPTAPRRLLASWTEVEVPTAPRRLYAAWTEMEVPTAPRRLYAAWTEMEVPTAPRRLLAAWAEVEAPSAPRRLLGSWAELEVPTLSEDVVVIDGRRWLVPTQLRRSRVKVPKPRKTLVRAPKRWQDIYDEDF